MKVKMICSVCGSVIAVSGTIKYKDKGQYHWFDIVDRSWTCEECHQMWLSSDSWIQIGNLVIPYNTDIYNIYDFNETIKELR